ncbi:endonuclease/exonuclease/phosphatase family protein [Desertibaculum subflavum]|uniref:endonuclease/exonuclease/phosphatase family protein n=1 Tax=Desertibaculum subflavum TaxID=2268458 RepID=UPI0013C41B9A
MQPAEVREPRLRLVSWNCAGAIAGKIGALQALRPDVAIIAEAASSDCALLEAKASVSGRPIWAGADNKKGLLIAAFGDWALIPTLVHPGREEIVARVGSGSVCLNIIALWPVQRKGGPTYTAIVADAIERHADMIKTGRTILAGDLNASVAMAGQAGRNLTGIVNRLSQAGLQSAYHISEAVEHGEEEEPTLYWRRRGSPTDRFHIDFVFAPAQMLSPGCASVGSYTDWVESGLSDHVPVIADLRVAAPASAGGADGVR